jgi:3-methyladenine DNA glycosylase AlkD
MNVPNIKKDEVMSILYLGAMLIAVFLVYKIFRGVGLIKNRDREQTREEKEQAASELRSSAYFDTGRTFVPSLGSQAVILATELRKAIRGIGTNEEAIFTVFGRLKSKQNITEIAVAYKKEFKHDLLTDILNDLTAKEQVILWDMISKIPG